MKIHHWLIMSFIFTFSLIVLAASDTDASYTPVKILRAALDHAANKYYGQTLASRINKVLFKNELSTSDLKELDETMLNPESIGFAEMAKNFNKKYSKILTTNEDYETEEDFAYLIYEEINTLYMTKDVQQEVINNIFTPAAISKIAEYVNLVKKEVIDEVAPLVMNNWNGRDNFIEMINSTQLFLPSLEKMDKNFSKTTINHKTAYAVLDDDNVEMPDDYLQYFKVGYSYYTTMNSSIGINKDGEANANLMIFPRIFYPVLGGKNLKDNLDFAFIGILAHELGHTIAYFSNSQNMKLFKTATAEEVDGIVNNVLIPFSICFEGAKKDFWYLRLGEARADAISFIVQSALAKKIGITDNNVYQEMLKKLKDGMNEKLKNEFDEHPEFRFRELILTGKCKMDVLPPYFLYNDYGEIDFGD